MCETHEVNKEQEEYIYKLRRQVAELERRVYLLECREAERYGILKRLEEMAWKNGWESAG